MAGLDYSRVDSAEEDGKACKATYISPHDAWIVPVVGGFAGAAAWFAATPFDTIKTMMQGHAVLVEANCGKGLSSSNSPIASVVSSLSTATSSSAAAAAATNTSGATLPLRPTPGHHAQSFAQTHTHALAHDASSRALQRSKWPEVMETTRKLVGEGGFARLYAGCGPSILRAMVTSSSRFSAFECTRYFMSKYFAAE